MALYIYIYIYIYIVVIGKKILSRKVCPTSQGCYFAAGGGGGGGKREGGLFKYSQSKEFLP